MNKSKIISLIIVQIILISMITFIPNIKGSIPCTARGYVYINGEIKKPERLTLIFTDQQIDADIYPDGYYVIDFNENIGEIGIFQIKYNGQEYYAEETITIQNNVLIYRINLTIKIPFNNPPNPPTSPIPANNSENVDINPTISIYVTDVDNDFMTISFYNASNPTKPIKVFNNIENNSRASITISDLSYNTTYYWYAVSNDSEYETQSEVFCFTTKKQQENSPPDAPTNPIPANNSKDIDITTTLSVYVSDINNDKMTVTFYLALFPPVQIQTFYNVESGSRPSTVLNDLSYNTTYYWYVEANDSEFTTQSEVFSFTTKKQDQENKPPEINIIKPEIGFLYFYGFKLMKIRSLKYDSIIIGPITVKVDATDNDGISRVEFYLYHLSYPKGKLVKNCTEEPFEFNWFKDRLRLFHNYDLKIVAYDNLGANSEIKMSIKKII